MGPCRSIAIENFESRGQTFEVCAFDVMGARNTFYAVKTTWLGTRTPLFLGFTVLPYRKLIAGSPNFKTFLRPEV